ncbi:isochorismatase family protein [Parapedomonas caeni]
MGDTPSPDRAAPAGGFAAAGYGQGRIGFGRRPAVLVVDFQRSFTDKAYPMGRSGHVDQAVENTARLLAVARAQGLPVATCSVGWGSRRDMGYWKVSSVYQDMFYGDAGMELDPRVADPSDFHFIKGAPSIFFGTPLQTFLVRQCVDTVIVTGCTTSGCVRASIVDAFSYGYRVIVPEPCCGDQELGAHQANLADVGRRYADVVGLDEVLAAIKGEQQTNA